MNVEAIEVIKLLGNFFLIFYLGATIPFFMTTYRACRYSPKFRGFNLSDQIELVAKFILMDLTWPIQIFRMRKGRKLNRGNWQND